MNYLIVGTNWLCRNYRAALPAAGDTFYAVVSRDEARGKEFARGEAKYYPTLEEALTDDTIDVVYLCLPNSLHAAAAEKCILAGKHVLCEKPLTADPEECRRIQTLAEEKGVILAEAVMSAYSPVMPALRKELSSQEVFAARLDYSQRSSKLDLIRSGGMASSFDRNLRGGALYDLGVYPLHFCATLFGAPKSVYARADWLRDVDVTDTLILEYGSFAVTVTASKAGHSRIGSEIQCDKITYAFDSVSVVNGGRKITKESTEPIDCGDVAVPLAKDASDAPSPLNVRVLRGFDAFVRGENREEYLHLREESYIVQEIMAEARRQIGYV